MSRGEIHSDEGSGRSSNAPMDVDDVGLGGLARRVRGAALLPIADGRRSPSGKVRARLRQRLGGSADGPGSSP